MPPRIARLAALGAFATAAGIALVCLALLYATRPTPTSGMDGTERFVTWLSVIGLGAALVGVHLFLGRQLLAAARGEVQEA